MRPASAVPNIFILARCLFLHFALYTWVVPPVQARTRGGEQMTIAQQINQLGGYMQADLAAWGVAIIGISITFAAITYVQRILR